MDGATDWGPTDIGPRIWDLVKHSLFGWGPTDWGPTDLGPRIWDLVKHSLALEEIKRILKANVFSENTKKTQRRKKNTGGPKHRKRRIYIYISIRPCGSHFHGEIGPHFRKCVFKFFAWLRLFEQRNLAPFPATPARCASNAGWRVCHCDWALPYWGLWHRPRPLAWLLIV